MLKRFARDTGHRELEYAHLCYLETLKKLILNSVYHPDQEVYLGKIWADFPTLSMIGKPRLDNIQQLGLNCVRDNIPGDFIEAGIWRGGAVALMAALLNCIDPRKTRKVYGADSFMGIPEVKTDLYPADEAHVGCHEIEVLKNNSMEEVIGYLKRLDLYDRKRIELLKGWFCDTLPALKKKKKVLALVRIDGDTYESTFHCLENLEPITSPGGYIIIDDYYSWEGCRQATDDYREKHQISSPLVTVDWTCVYWKK